MPDTELLILIAARDGPRTVLSTSTSILSKALGCSQQTISRKLRGLASQNLVELSTSPKGVDVKLSEKGIALLKSRFAELKSVFKESPSFLKGSFSIGLGEGQYYMSRPGYVSRFKKALGFKPFAGTLNLVIDEATLSSFLFGSDPVEIKGFATGERSFGAIKAFPVLVEKKYNAAIIFPERSSHESNVIEVISPLNLRKKLKLKEGTSVKLFS